MAKQGDQLLGEENLQDEAPQTPEEEADTQQELESGVPAAAGQSLTPGLVSPGLTDRSNDTTDVCIDDSVTISTYRNAEVNDSEGAPIGSTGAGGSLVSTRTTTKDEVANPPMGGIANIEDSLTSYGNEHKKEEEDEIPQRNTKGLKEDVSEDKLNSPPSGVEEAKKCPPVIRNDRNASSSSGTRKSGTPSLLTRDTAAESPPPFAAVTGTLLDTKTVDHDTANIRRQRRSLSSSTATANSSRSLPGAYAVHPSLASSTNTCPPLRGSTNARVVRGDDSTRQSLQSSQRNGKEESKQEEANDSETAIPMIPVEFAPQPAASVLVAVGEEINDNDGESAEQLLEPRSLSRIPISRHSTDPGVVTSSLASTPLSRDATDPGSLNPPPIGAPTGRLLSSSLRSNTNDDTTDHTERSDFPVPQLPEPEPDDPVTTSSPYAAEGSGSLHMIVAELVGPLVRAVQVVLFDDEGRPIQQPQDGDTSVSHGPQEGARIEGVEQRRHSSEKNSFGSMRRGVWLFLACLTVSLCIGIPLLVINSEENSSTSHIEDPTPTPLQFDYDCFHSTADFLQAQQDAPKEQDLFIFCPETEIQIGTIANIYNNDTRFINGEPPIMVILSNVEVRCGLDGSVENNCVFVGGLTQVIFQPVLPGPERFQLIYSEPSNNVTIRGMTFTGFIDIDPFLGGSSASLSNSGDVMMVDCLWENMSSAFGLIYVGNNRFQDFYGLEPIPAQSARLTIANSTFRNLEYDSAFADAFRQTLKFTNCRFEDVRMIKEATQCDSAGDIWCQGLINCVYGSICELENICIENFEYASAGILASFSNSSQMKLMGNFYTEELKHSQKAEVVETCPSGIARIDDMLYALDCLDIEEMENQWTRKESCSAALL